MMGKGVDMHLNHLYSKLNGEIHITQWQTTKMKKISNGKGLSTHIEFFNYLSLSINNFDVQLV